MDSRFLQQYARRNFDTKMDIETAYTTVGDYGRFHRKYFWTLAPAWLYFAFHQIHNVYLGAELDFTCVQGEKEMKGCPETGSCSSIKFHSEYTSIVSEWELVCKKSYLASSVQSYFFFGGLLSNLIFGNLADRFGRKHLIWSASVLSGICSLIGGFVTNYWVYCAMRFFTGIFIGAVGLVGFVLLSETLPKAQNSFMGLMLACVFAVGIPVFSLVAYCIADWRMLTIATSVPGLLGLYYYWFLNESPRWLYTKGRLSEAERILYKMYKGNNPGKNAPNMSLKQISEEGEVQHVSAIKMFTNRILLRRSLISLPSWFMFSAIYYGMTMSAGSLGGNRFISVSLSGVVEIPAYLVSMVIIDRLGRRGLTGGCLIICSLPCFGILLLPAGNPAITVTLGLVGKMTVSAAFSIVYVFVAELYPTVVRNSAVGICSTAAGIGSVAAPLITPLGQFYPALDYFVYGCMALISGILMLQLPDTTGKPMPETLDDLYR